MYGRFTVSSDIQVPIFLFYLPQFLVLSSRSPLWFKMATIAPSIALASRPAVGEREKWQEDPIQFSLSCLHGSSMKFPTLLVITHCSEPGHINSMTYKCGLEIQYLAEIKRGVNVRWQLLSGLLPLTKDSILCLL